MRRFAATILLATLFTAACSDQKIESPTGASPASISAALAAGDPGDAASIESLINQLFGQPGVCSGNCNAAVTRFQHIEDLFTNCTLVPPQSPCDQAAAIGHTYDLIDYVLKKWNEGTLNNLPSYPGGTPQAVTDLINLMYRYVGIDSTLCSLGTDCNATVYQPGSPAETLITPSGQAGINLPPGTGTVTQPTVISVYRVDDPSVLLTTELDQYPFRYVYSSSSAEGTTQPLAQDVVVEVCLQSGLTFPPGALGRLALAHDIAEPAPYEGIQILPSAPNQAFLTSCGSVAATSTFTGNLAVRSWRFVSGGLASVFAAEPLYALIATTGRTGTTKTLSPFGAVDTLGYITANSPTSGLNAPEGGTVTAPSVRVLTPGQLADSNPTGPGMASIPVTFTVTAGGGCFANPCTPSSPTTLVVNTDASGYASVPAWTVGAGTNTVTAAASIPCATPLSGGTDCGTILTTTGGSILTFTATGYPATQVNFSSGTLTILTGFQGTTYAPGTAFNVIVLVQDSEPTPQTVPGSGASVTLGITNGGTLICPSGCTQTAEPTQAPQASPDNRALRPSTRTFGYTDAQVEAMKEKLKGIK